jgi:hypothetical protein
VTTWADVAKGDRVELGGQEWRVEKIKPKGKRAKVTVSAKRGTFTNEVKLKDAVTLPGAAPLHDDAGAQTRWAVTADEAAETVADVWDTPTDKAEKRLAKILGARLVGESHDGGKEWYVPPVDVSTVTSHWMVFHGGDAWHTVSSSDLLPLHVAEHAEAAAGTRILEVAHVHTEERP